MSQTFDFLVPARVFFENGGSLFNKDIVTSCNLNSEKYRVETFEKKTVLMLKKGEEVIKTHIDLCWVISKVLI